MFGPPALDSITETKELLAVSSGTSLPINGGPLKVTMNGPPLTPLTVTLPFRAGMVLRLVCSCAGVRIGEYASATAVVVHVAGPPNRPLPTVPLSENVLGP